MKIVLLNSIIGEATPWLKHGLGMVSSCLKKEGFDVQIVNNPDEELIMYHDVHLVGINGITSSVPRIRAYAKQIKSQNKKCIVVAGGVSVTLSSEFLDDCKDIDYLYKGEAEITFVEMIKKFASDGTLPDDRYIEGQIVHDMDALPFVDRTGFEKGEHKFTLLTDFTNPMYSILNSRWCRKKCRFCAPAMSTLFGGIRKLRSVDNFFEEIKTLPYKDMTLMIHDDNMLENKDWCMELVEKFKAEDLYIPFVMQAYPPEVANGRDLLKSLMEVGLIGVLVGFESGNDEMLKFMKKGSTREINISAAYVMNDLGLRVQANIMFGNPTETTEQMMDTVSLYNDHINQPGFSVPSPAVYTPYPGSEWYEMLKENGDINIGKNFQLFERYAWTAGKLKSVDYNAVNQAMQNLIPFRGFHWQNWEQRAKLMRRLST